MNKLCLPYETIVCAGARMGRRTQSTPFFPLRRTDDISFAILFPKYTGKSTPRVENMYVRSKLITALIPEFHYAVDIDSVSRKELREARVFEKSALPTTVTEVEVQLGARAIWRDGMALA